MTEKTNSALPEPFSFYKAILTGDHLHFGLWPEDRPQMAMEEAQENMFGHLLSFFPPPPAKVLDVGCGLGYSAHLLSEKGYEVTALAPSAELISYAGRKYGQGGASFMNLGFFDDNPVFADGLYDIIFFQESMQYLSPLPAVMERARKLLRENGLLIMGDEVCYSREIKHLTAVHMSADLTVALSEGGFKITERERIGRQVSPTCGFIVGEFTSKFGSLASLSGEDASAQLRHYLNGWEDQQRWYADGRMGYELIVAKKDPFFIRPYSSGDENTILPMFNEIFHVNRSMDHWNWKFRDNPYGSHKISEVISHDGALAAHYAGYPVPFYDASGAPATFVAYQIGDTMTRPGARNIGLGKTGLLARVANHFYAKYCEGLPFIYGFNTGHIKKLGTRYLGYTYISPVPYWVKDLSKSPVKHPSRIRKLLAGYTVAEVRSTSSEWDKFFSRVTSSYLFLVRRDSAYIKWRYLDCPDKVHRIFEVRKRGELVGWSVFTLRGRKLIWGDALFDKRYPEALSSLLSDLTKHYFPQVDTVEGWFSSHPRWWGRSLEEAGFMIAKEPDDLVPGFVIFGDDNTIKEKLEGRLYYTWGDSDLF